MAEKRAGELGLRQGRALCAAKRSESLDTSRFPARMPQWGLSRRSSVFGSARTETSPSLPHTQVSGRLNDVRGPRNLSPARNLAGGYYFCCHTSTARCLTR
jgi:hypothetical protein